MFFSLISVFILSLISCDTTEQTTPLPQYPRLPEANPALVELMSGDTLFYNPFDSLRFVPGVTISARQPNHGKLFFVKRKESFAYVPDQGFVGNDTLKFDARYSDNTSKRYVVPVQVNVRCFVEIKPDFIEDNNFDSILVYPVLRNDIICRPSIDRVEGYSNNSNLIISGDAGGNLTVRNRNPTFGTDTVFYNVIASGRVIGSSFLIITRNDCDSYFRAVDDSIVLNVNSQVTIPYNYLLANDVACNNYLDLSYLSTNPTGISQNSVTVLNNSANRELAIITRQQGTAIYSCRIRSLQNPNIFRLSNLYIRVR